MNIDFKRTNAIVVTVSAQMQDDMTKTKTFAFTPAYGDKNRQAKNATMIEELYQFVKLISDVTQPKSKQDEAH